MKLIKSTQFYKNVFRLMLPIALQNMLFIFLNLLDTIMLGKFGESSEAAISAANIGNQPFFIYSLFIFGTVSGASVLMSQYWGRGDTDSINKVAGIALTFCLGIGTVFTLIVAIFPSRIIGFYTKSPEVTELGTQYLTAVLFSYIPAAISQMLTGIMRSVEKVKVALMSSIIAVFTNMFFNWCLIFGVLGFPSLGVVGAAYGTVIARATELIFVLIYVFAVDKVLTLRLSKMFRFTKVLVLDFIKISIPVVMNETVWSLGITLHAAIIGNIGKEAYAAYSIASVIENVALIFTMGFANAGAIIVGKAVGSSKNEEAYSSAQTLLVLSTATGLILGAGIFASSGFATGFFNINEATKNNAVNLLSVMSVVVAFKAFNALNIVGIMRGGGDTKYCMLLDILPMWLFSVPTGAIAAFFLKLPVYFVYGILMSDEVVKIFFGLYRFVSKKWIKNVTRDKDPDSCDICSI